MKNLLGCLLVLAAACGGGGGSNDTTGDDTPGTDAAIDVVVPTTFTISGTASSRGLNGNTPEAGVLIGAYSNSDENTALATSTTDAQGAFSLTITSSGAALDGFLKATKTGLKTSYLYPPTPVAADLAMVPMNMLTPGNFDILDNLAGGMQLPANGTVAVIVLSASALSSTPVAGASISTSPASNPYRYNSGGLPSKTATSTAADGIGYAFNSPVGSITVTAAKSGTTFKPTTLKVHADALTQTIVSP